MSKENLKQKNCSSNKGITLIALIITIVVMLILVAVTLDITLGENGLVNKAKTAGEATTKAVEQETLLTAAVGAMDNNGTVNFTVLDGSLPEGFTGSNGTYTSKNGNTFTVTTNGTVTNAGDSNNTPVAVDLNGRYYYDLNDKESYYEIKDYNKFIYYDSEYGYEEMESSFTVDEVNQTLIWEYSYENFNDCTLTNEVYNETEILQYWIFEENGQIINKVIDFGGAYLFQSSNGIEYLLNGDYISEDGRCLLSFTQGESSCREVYKSGDSWNYSSDSWYDYWSIQGMYFRESAYSMEVSDDLSTIKLIDYDGEDEVYIKQSEN